MTDNGGYVIYAPIAVMATAMVGRAIMRLNSFEENTR